MKRETAVFIAIVVANYLGASVGKLMAIPPGNVTPVWPPSGLALAALLILGRTYWPAVWLASFAFNLNFFEGFRARLGPHDLVCAALIASGSALQAVVGAMVFNYGSDPMPRRFQPGRFLRRLAGAGPLACLLGATIGAGALCLTGFAPPSAYFNIWITWWFGDAVGVFVVGGSILLAHFQSRQKEEEGNSEASSRYLWPAFSFMVLLLALGGTLWGWAVLRARTALDDREHFERIVDEAAHTIEARLHSYEAVLDTAAGIVSLSPQMTREEWTAFLKTAQIERHYPGIWGMGVVARVPPERLAGLIDEARRTVSPDFQVRRLDKSSPHGDSFVVRLIEPLSRNQAALGLDLASETRRREAAEAAEQTGQAQVTRMIRLIQDQRKQTGFLLLVPVRQHDSGRFTGWVYAPFAARTLFSDIAPRSDPEFTFSVYEQNEGSREEIYSHPVPPAAGQRQPLTREQVLQFGGRRWLVSYAATSSLRISPFASQASLLLVFGLALTCLLSALLVSLVSTRSQALALAYSSARALLESNDRLSRQNLELESARQEALTASRLKSEFLANTSHEIRTPLNGVLGMNQLLLTTALNAEQRDYAETVQNSAQALMSVLNDILDLSKIEAGKLEVECISFDLNACLQEVRSLMALRGQQQGIVFRTQFHEELPAWVLGDPVRIRQILLNLLTNAFKFTSEGEVRLKVLPCESGLIRFEVSDTGKGIAPDKLCRLFEKFSQEDSSTTRLYGGTGLGLAICKSLASLMGGNIGVESQLGAGSTFWFSLPLPGSQPLHRPATFNSEFQFERPWRVLLADDNRVNQKVAAQMLAKLGAEVEIVSNGSECVTRASQSYFDLILMDCQMPEMDGYEATQIIRCQNRAIPIIALTANAMKGESERCLEAGMNDYLSKPLCKDALAQAVRRWLPRSSTVGTRAS